MRFLRDFLITVFCLLALCSCAGKTATETIVDEHVQLVDCALVDLGKNPDINKAKEALKTCRAGLLSVQQTHAVEIAKCKAETDYWRLSSAGLFVALCLAIFFIIRRKAF